ncbi:MAG: DUF5329 domain-containing protein [Pseudomonadota bacterium]
MKMVILAGSLLAANMAAAATAETAKAEVAHLLTAVEQSQCKFNRNGSWHDAKKARQHLAKKFDYIEKKGLATTAEKYIELGGATSSSSGKPYQMKCADGAPVNSATWLGTELKKYRAQK